MIYNQNDAAYYSMLNAQQPPNMSNMNWNILRGFGINQLQRNQADLAQMQRLRQNIVQNQQIGASVTQQPLRQNIAQNPQNQQNLQNQQNQQQQNQANLVQMQQQQQNQQNQQQQNQSSQQQQRYLSNTILQHQLINRAHRGPTSNVSATSTFPNNPAFNASNDNNNQNLSFNPSSAAPNQQRNTNT